jgi:hypothetical protein
LKEIKSILFYSNKRNGEVPAASVGHEEDGGQAQHAACSTTISYTDKKEEEKFPHISGNSDGIGCEYMRKCANILP